MLLKGENPFSTDLSDTGFFHKDQLITNSQLMTKKDN